MKPQEKISVFGKELTLEEIERIESPALRNILREHFLHKSEQQSGLCSHTKYTDYTKHSKYDRFPWCGIAPGD